MEHAHRGGDRHRRLSGKPVAGSLPDGASRWSLHAAEGGFFHDGRFATLRDVVDHYDGAFGLGLFEQEKSDLIEYPKSL